MSQKQLSRAEKFAMMSPELRAHIAPGERSFTPNPNTPVTNHLVMNKRHCNGGAVVDAGFSMKAHCDAGGQLVVSLAGAFSTFEGGVALSRLIRAGKVGSISCTGANYEESWYRPIAHSHYYRFPRYGELTPAQEKELAKVGDHRITTSMLPEQESTRVLYDPLETLWREAEASGASHLWHWYFEEAVRRGMIEFDPAANLDDCWAYQAMIHNVPVIVPGWEDSTMGNIFTHATYAGDHEFLGKYKLEKPVSIRVVEPAFVYMHRFAEWYMTATKTRPQYFLQLGGGIAGDFPICAVPHVKKDYLANESQEVQEALVPAWAGFTEVHLTPMSAGSYSGAGGKEKVSWDKLEPDSPYFQIFGDFTDVFPDLAAIILGE